MRIGVVSDLHLEFHRDGGDQLVSTLMDRAPVDVLVVAGDLAVGEGLRGALKLICSRFHGTPVVYVPGNHEYYTSSFAATEERIAGIVGEAGAKIPNLRYLNFGMEWIDGVCFVGATLWFQRSNVLDRTNDFRVIKDFEPRVYEENRQAVGFLREHVQPGSVVVTHYLPSWKSVAPAYRGAASNAFFVHDMEPLIHERRPALWIHGHTHTACDYEVGATRVVCNPLGYPHELSGGFDPCKVVEVAAP